MHLCVAVVQFCLWYLNNEMLYYFYLNDNTHIVHIPLPCPVHENKNYVSIYIFSIHTVNLKWLGFWFFYFHKHFRLINKWKKVSLNYPSIISCWLIMIRWSFNFFFDWPFELIFRLAMPLDILCSVNQKVLSWHNSLVTLSCLLIKC